MVKRHPNEMIVGPPYELRRGVGRGKTRLRARVPREAWARAQAGRPRRRRSAALSRSAVATGARSSAAVSRAWRLAILSSSSRLCLLEALSTMRISSIGDDDDDDVGSMLILHATVLLFPWTELEHIKWARMTYLTDETWRHLATASRTEMMHRHQCLENWARSPNVGTGSTCTDSNTSFRANAQD